MRNGIQTPEIIASIDKLNLNDSSVDLPTLDPSSLTATYAIDPGWINSSYFGSGIAATSINGSSVDWRDAGNGILLAGLWNTAPEMGEQRYYECIGIDIAGGTVNPVPVNIYIDNLVFSVPLIKTTVANPGTMSIRGVYIPPGLRLRLIIGNGGAGDTARVDCLGVRSDPGVPLPILGGPTISGGT
jgi:hypothetical protein